MGRDYSASMTEKPRTPALQEAAKRRRTLHEALVGLEFAISSPAAGRIPDWTSLVTKEVTAIRDAWDQHVDTTEKPGGEMLARLEQVEIGGLPWPLEDARDDLQRFIGKVIRHRQKGADLVWEAYNLDIGGPE